MNSRVNTAFRWIFIFAFTAGWTGCTTTPTPPAPAERGVAAAGDPTDVPWAYDPGPSPENPMGKELIDLVADQPFMPGISKELSGTQKFRPAFGPTLWRMLQTPNSVKILFIGQDGTHIAEAAGRTATAGFGGRAQDLAAYFGVNNGAAFMNTFAFTIRGQYSSFGTPIISNEGGPRVNLGSVVENSVWMMAQDQNSPMVKWRNRLIEWIIRNNRQSLKMIVLFGGSAQDSIGTFIESRGGRVGTQYTASDIATKQIRIPNFDLVSAGGNNEFPVVLDKRGNDLYQRLAGRRLNYSLPQDQAEAQNSLKQSIGNAINDLAFTNGGLGQSGIVHPAQINGYDLNKIEINGQKTLSLRGLRLSDGSAINQDILIAEFPHPTALSMMKPDEASTRIARSLQSLSRYVNAGWRIDADPGMTNQFAAGQRYFYGRTDIGPAYYDFGTPKNRMVSVSSASRMPRMANVIVIGTRDRVSFNNSALMAASKARMPSEINPAEMLTARPRLPNTRYVFDRGPGPEMARLMKENLNMAEIGRPKPGMSPKTSGIAAFNIKTDPRDVGDFGHYRGTFRNPKVIILADPDGVDDILTARALTGTRGQYLQALMNNMRVGDQYLVIKTVPFGMDGATDAEWATVLAQTANYRQQIFRALLSQGRPDVIIADGKYAGQEIRRLVGAGPIPVVSIFRNGTENNSGLREAAAELGNLPMYRGLQAPNSMAIIPRSHLGFFSRVWEGTGGTHVFDAQSPADKGSAFAIVAPEWAFKQPSQQSPAERQGVDLLKRVLYNQGAPASLQRNQPADDDTSFRYSPAPFFMAPDDSLRAA